MNIPSTGVNNSKVKFFKEVAVAFEFLSFFHSLEEAQQAELMELITQIQAKKG